MAAAFVQALFTGQSKTAGTSLAITGSKTVAVGNTIFVAFASDDAGSAHTVVDNLGNVYSLVKEQINTGAVKTQLWSAPVTVGGTLTSQTISWTTNVTAKAASSGEFSGIGATVLTQGNNAAGASCFPLLNAGATPDSGIGIGACGFESASTDTYSTITGTLVGTVVGTSGGGASSNITTALLYILGPVTNTILQENNTSRNPNSAGSGAIYTQKQTRNPIIHFNDPGVMMKSWSRQVGRIFVPDLWLPSPT